MHKLYLLETEEEPWLEEKPGKALEQGVSSILRTRYTCLWKSDLFTDSLGSWFTK